MSSTITTYPPSLPSSFTRATTNGTTTRSNILSAFPRPIPTNRPDGAKIIANIRILQLLRNGFTSLRCENIPDFLIRLVFSQTPSLDGQFKALAVRDALLAAWDNKYSKKISVVYHIWDESGIFSKYSDIWL